MLSVSAGIGAKEESKYTGNAFTLNADFESLKYLSLSWIYSLDFFLCILLYNIWDIYHFFSFLLQDEGQTFVTQDIYCAS